MKEIICIFRNEYVLLYKADTSWIKWKLSMWVSIPDFAINLLVLLLI